MNTQKLLLDRLEFVTVKVESTSTDEEFVANKVFPQLNFDFSDVSVLTKSSLHYSDEEADDPRHFALRYGVKIDKDQPKGTQLPYLIEVEATGFFRYTGGDEYVAAERFRAVRFSGYQLLYGAIREMVANITARGRYGLLQLPARTFGVIAKERAEEDEAERQERLRRIGASKSKVSTRKKRSTSLVQGSSSAVKEEPKKRVRAKSQGKK